MTTIDPRNNGADAAHGCDADTRNTHESYVASPSREPDLRSTLIGIVPATTALAASQRRRLFSPPPFTAQPAAALAMSEQLEAFRELRTRLIKIANSIGLTYFTTLIVGITPDSGASFVARNLAAAFTLQDRRVALLIDCNYRHPTQQPAPGATSEHGLFDFFEQLASPPQLSIEQLVRQTDIAGLYLIPAGRCEARTARQYEHFSSPPMRAMMSALRDEPCYVFLDGPALKGSPDARILSELADFVVLVVGYGRATGDEIAQAASLFDKNKLAGVVFNERMAEGRPPARRER